MPLTWQISFPFLAIGVVRYSALILAAALSLADNVPIELPIQ
jgi:hypothetical protein